MIFDPLDLNADNVRGIWENLRDEITNHDPKLSPNAAGSIAAARVMNAVGKKAKDYIDEIDARVKRGESITDAEDDKYIHAQTAAKNVYKLLVDLSGYRPGAGAEDHPLAQRPLDAEPLENTAAKQAAERSAHAAKAAEVAQSVAATRAEQLAKSKAFEDREHAGNVERKRKEKVGEWHQKNGTLLGVGRRDSVESIEAKKKAAILSALAAGKRVPPEVLADYPELSVI